MGQHFFSLQAQCWSQQILYLLLHRKGFLELTKTWQITPTVSHLNNPSTTLPQPLSHFCKELFPLAGACSGKQVHPSSAACKSTVSFSDLLSHPLLVCRQLARETFLFDPFRISGLWTQDFGSHTGITGLLCPYRLCSSHALDAPCTCFLANGDIWSGVFSCFIWVPEILWMNQTASPIFPHALFLAKGWHQFMAPCLGLQTFPAIQDTTCSSHCSSAAAQAAQLPAQGVFLNSSCFILINLPC